MYYEGGDNFVGLIRSTIALEEAKTVAEIERLYKESQDCLMQIVSSAYYRVHATDVGNLKTELHDARVQAMGGM